MAATRTTMCTAENGGREKVSKRKRSRLLPMPPMIVSSAQGTRMNAAIVAPRPSQ